MNKKDLRKAYLSKRKELTIQECEVFSQQISTLFFESIELKLVQWVHLFLPIVKNNEVDTWKIIDIFRKEFPHIQLVIPKSDFSNNTMQHFLFTEETTLEENKYGILEPINGIQVEEKQLDLIITPLLVFDKQGFRVGYGGGFYDRFFEKCQKGVLKIGVCFDENIEKISDINPYDKALTHCISPTKLYTFFS